MKTKILSVMLAASLAVTSFVSLAITASARDLSNITGQYTVMNGEVLTGTIKYNCWVVVPAGYSVTLRDVTIDGSRWTGTKWAAITVTSGSNGDSSTINLEGTNTVKGFNEYYPGIFVSPGKTLYIEGSGTLNVSGGDYAPGIGTAYDYDNDAAVNCGNIVINGGTVNATGGEWAAGIGSGTVSTCGNITINGGTVNATGGGFGAGIGSGAGSECGNITINGGTVTATGGDGAVGIGSGVVGICGNITITDGVTRVTAVKGGSRTAEGLEVVPNCIGASEQAEYADWYGYDATVGTITIGGDTHVDTGVSPYIYEPVHAVPATATYAQVGEDYTSSTNDASKDTASLWRVTVTPGDTDITSLSVDVNGHRPEAPLSNMANISGASEVVYGVVINKSGADVTSFTALVNGEAVDTAHE